MNDFDRSNIKSELWNLNDIYTARQILDSTGCNLFRKRTFFFKFHMYVMKGYIQPMSAHVLNHLDYF